MNNERLTINKLCANYVQDVITQINQNINTQNLFNESNNFNNFINNLNFTLKRISYYYPCQIDEDWVITNSTSIILNWIFKMWKFQYGYTNFLQELNLYVKQGLAITHNITRSYTTNNTNQGNSSGGSSSKSSTFTASSVNNNDGNNVIFNNEISQVTPITLNNLNAQHLLDDTNTQQTNQNEFNEKKTENESETSFDMNEYFDKFNQFFDKINLNINILFQELLKGLVSFYG